MATGTSSTSGGPNQTWCTLQASPRHMFVSLLLWFPHAVVMLLMGEHAGSQSPLSLINLLGHMDNGIISGTYEGPHGGVLRGHLFSFLCLWSLGAPVVVFLPHGGCIMEQTLQQEESQLLPVGSGPVQVFPP